MDMYYNSSVGDIDRDVQDVMCRATNLSPLEHLTDTITEEEEEKEEEVLDEELDEEEKDKRSIKDKTE